jgi:hypothetical protein
MKLQITITAICMAFGSHAAIQTPCSKIVLNSGRIIEVATFELNPTEIRYKRCGQTTDIDYFVAKEAVLVIKNSQDEVILIRKSAENESIVPENKKKYEIFSFLALAFVLVMPLLGVIFAGISSHRMYHAPQKYNKTSKKMLKWVDSILITYTIMLAIVFILILKYLGL